MSDPVQNFVFILKKQCTKQPLSLYSDKPQQNKHTYKPQDVLSSVSLQLKAIHQADSLKSVKCVNKNIENFKKCSFLSVNKLPVYEEVPKQTTKFDTQCVSDTQLINIIEDAEIIDIHRGMTQEFETSFCHHTEKYDIEEGEKTTDAQSAEKDKRSVDKIHKNISEDVIKSNSDRVLINSTENNDTDIDDAISIISPIMCSNNITEKEIGFDSPVSRTDENTQVEKFSQISNECIEIDEEELVIEKPLSPIFMHKNVKQKFKTPSPLVFNLDKFEQFEKIAMPILEANDLKTAKCVINSQILDKELHIQMDEEILLNDRDMLSPVLQNKSVKEVHNSNLNIETEFKSYVVKDPNLEADLEFIELDKATSDDLISKVMNENPEGKAGSEILKDELLFSSDEEDSYIHRDYQDLPFTCALETSFYEQSDVLDKTMYVSFQTASNKSIQIFTDSFARAKNLLNDVPGDEVTVTDLVKNCDSYVKNKTQDVEEEQGKNVSVSLKTELKLTERYDEESELVFAIGNTVEEVKINDIKPAGKSSFEGFKTASNKAIRLSEKALSRCKKVFQDIDVNENFDNQAEKDNLEKIVECENKLLAPEKSKSNVNKSFADDIQNIDDIIIQEFENIEMSLEEDKGPDKNVTSVGFKTASNKNIKISDVALAKIKDVFKDIDFDEDLSEFDNKEANKELNGLPKMVEGPQLSKNMSNDNFEGFKTASNKNIHISKETMAKSKDIFEDIGSTKFPKKSIESLDKLTQKCFDVEMPSTSNAGFVGFKTANNKDIKISEQALGKSKDIFKDIDSIDFELPKKMSNDFKNDTIKLNEPSTSKTSSVGFKAANNKNINISKDSLAKTKNIFKDIDSLDFKLPKSNNEDLQDEKNREDIEGFIDFNQPSTSKASFGGFKTANNREIKISDAALAKTKNIFNDIDSSDFKLPEKISKALVEDDLIDKETKELQQKSELIDLYQPSTSKSTFAGFKTANNRKISISKECLAKTRNIFKDIDSNDFKLLNKPDEHLKETGKEEKSSYPDLKHHQPPLSGCSFVGFKTANNKVINVSETALAKTKNIFKDIDATELQVTETRKEDYPIIEERSNDLRKDSNESCDIVKDDPITEKNTTASRFLGFQTASNKQVKVSEDAIIQSRKIFQDINSDVRQTVDNDIHKYNVTGDNTDVGKADEFLQSGKASPIFKGFQTGNKKPVTVSKEALAKSKKLFQDIDAMPNDDFEPEFHGFKTANDKEVKVSDKAVTETKKLFENSKTFKGVQTASDKKVLISEDSLVKCRKLFHDFDTQNNKNIDKKASNINFGFKTGSNRDVVISEEALARSKRLFSDIDDTNENEPKNKKDKISSEENIANIIDTQVLNNFDESLHTEDFHDSPVKSKRSGSPILSCPRAKKKKKFETPYSQKVIIKPELKKEIININVKKTTFNENYKKNKKYTLKDLDKFTQNDNTTIDPYLRQFNFDNLLTFEFHDKRNELSYGNMTIELLKELFLNSVSHKLVPNGWLDNHLKLILWKLISYEIKLKSNVVCSARNVIDQLKYRYDKELYYAQRPALRKILEKDDVATKTLVLCVAGIYEDDVNVASATTTNNLELLLTDGWYCIRANIDKMLAQLVCVGKICVGTKIVTNGAELVGCEQGISPWEDTSAVRLKLFGNSTRRARWDARLGYHSNSAILSQLSSVQLDGGKVSKLRVFVTRVYPALYVEKFEDGSTVTRSERLEHLHQMKSEAERQVIMEKIYEEVEKEFSDQESQDSEGLSNSGTKRTCLDSGSQIAKLMKKSKDPGEFRATLTSSQSRLLEAHTSKHRERLLEDIQKRVREKIEKAGVCVNRNVVTLLKIRVAGVTDKNGVEVTKGMMSIWKPNEAILEIIKEGSWIDVINVVPTAVRYSEIQISAGRQSAFSTSKYKEPEKFKPFTKLLKRNCYTIKDLSLNPSLSTDYNEIDTVGIIFLIDPSVQEFDSTKQPFQNVFLADADKNMICVNFWGGLKKFGFQNLLDTGQGVACTNLQKRAGNTRKSIPQYRVTEFSYFTKTPKNENARNLLDDLNKKFQSLDRRKFCEDCVVLKNNYSVIKHNNENISPYRFNNSDFNMSKNKMFIDSPLARINKIDDNFNLTGLDFESTFKQTDTQLPEEILLRKKKVNEKIARLKMYGEPPPLSTIHILNRSKNASSSYKSPLITNNNNAKNVSKTSKSESVKPLQSKSDSSANVANVEETPEKCANLNDSDVMCSPLLLNRTYVKNVNPVKINFDMKDNNDSNVDHFAEEFDGSPPLSLD